MHVCMYMCIHAYARQALHICTYIYIHTHIHTDKQTSTYLEVLGRGILSSIQDASFFKDKCCSA